MISSYEITLYLFSVFLLVFGVILTLAARDIPARETRGMRQIVSPKSFFIFVALVYFALAHFNIYAVLVMNIDNGNIDCGERVANVTYDGSTYLMSYRNTCTAYNPETTIQILNIYQWLLWWNILMVNIGLLAFVFKKFKNW